MAKRKPSPPPDYARVCSKGHDIPAGVMRCLVCRAARAQAQERKITLARQAKALTTRHCARGLHVLPPGTRRCDACHNAGKRAKRSGVPPEVVSYLFTTLPPAEVLDGAACSIELAYLFDPAGPRNDGVSDEVTKSRHNAAKRLCAGCPVRQACYDDAYANRREGVYGGVVFSSGFWISEGVRRTQALVQPVQGVPDSAAC